MLGHTLICWTTISKATRLSCSICWMFYFYWLFTRWRVSCCVELLFNWSIRQAYWTSRKTLAMHFTQHSWTTTVVWKRTRRRLNSVDKRLQVRSSSCIWGEHVCTMPWNWHAWTTRHHKWPWGTSIAARQTFSRRHDRKSTSSFGW